MGGPLSKYGQYMVIGYGGEAGIVGYFLGNHFLVAALLRRPSRTGDN